MGATPTGCLVTGTVAGEMVAVTARGGTTFTVAIKTPNPAAYGVTAGTTQDLTWQCAK